MTGEKTALCQPLFQALGLTLLGIVLGIAANSFRTDGIPLVGEWSPEARITTESGESLILPFEDAKKLFEAGNAFFLDARSADDYEAGHIQGARNLPWLEFDSHFDRIMQNIPEDRMIVTYCEGETCELSKELARALIDMGFPNVRVLVNGWGVWKAHGLPVTVGGTP